MSFRTMHEDYLDPDKYFGKPPDEYQHPKIHWAIRKMVRNMVGSDGLGRFYRAVYKGTACGPSIGFLIDGKWYYCDDLYRFHKKILFNDSRPQRLKKSTAGYFERFDTARTDRHFWQNHVVTGISVSSIVEGSDAEVPGEHITDPTLDREKLEKEFWKTVDYVNDEVNHLWLRDNSRWLILSHPDEDSIYWKITDGDSPDFYDGDRDLVPEPVIEKALTIVDEWCNNCAYDAEPVMDGWSVSAYEVTD